MAGGSGGRLVTVWHFRLGLAAIVLCSLLLRFRVLRSVDSPAEERRLSFQVASFLRPPSEEGTQPAGASVQYEQQAVKDRRKKKGQRKAKAKKKPSVRGQVEPGPSFENLKDLPAFADSHEFYVLGSTLTRDARLGQLLVDTFFMGAKVLRGGASFFGVQEPSDAFELAKSRMTVDVSLRRNEGYFCLLQVEGEGYKGMQAEAKPIRAVVVPTATTVDGNVNDMVNIVRCELPRGMQQHVKRRREGQLQVQFLEKVRGSLVDVVNYSLPIDQRTTGYVSYPGDTATLDPWRVERDDLHMCIPGLRSEFTTPLPEMVVEFLEYHVMQGVQHFYLGVDYKWGSRDMIRLQLVLEQYLDDGLVSISSTDVIDGATVDSECKKTMFFNQCLYHAKSAATWVGIWDFDEFLIPRSPPNRNILDLIRQHTGPPPPPPLAENAENENAENAEDRPVALDGSSVGDVCFLLLTSYSHALPKGVDASSDRRWIGERFAATREAWHDDAWKKSILSTQDVYYTGFHVPGACTANGHDWTRLVRDDDPAYAVYARHIDKEDAAMFHFRCVLTLNTYVRSPSLEPSEYALHYFERVRERLERRGMHTFLESLRGGGMAAVE